MKIRNLMKTNVITIKSSDTVKNALDIMNGNRVNGTPVVDDNNELSGIVVKADIYRFLVEQGHYDTYPIETVMNKDVVIASPDEDVKVIAKRLRFNNIIAMPVVDANKVIGFVSWEDILDYFMEEN